jgi:hypothetical protein
MNAYTLQMNGNKNSQSSAPSRSIKGRSVIGSSSVEKSNRPNPQAVVTTNLNEVTIEAKKPTNF